MDLRSSDNPFRFTPANPESQTNGNHSFFLRKGQKKKRKIKQRAPRGSPLPARMAPASTSPPAKARVMTAPAKSPLLGGIGDLDTAVSLRLHTLFLPVPRLLLKALEVAGDGRIWLPIPISLLLISTTTSSKVSPLLVGLVVGLVLDILFVGVTKLIVRRPRPAYNAADMYVAVAADHWSFPSGHSSRAFLVAAFLAAGGFPRVALFFWAAATSASRVLLGRHYVLDVVTGACLGVFEAWLSSLLLRSMCTRISFLVC
ncbi:hypothetical protein E2562_024687 [Oryza meyeriana var. granulata]|uniref:Phosphatidic acid phosphatase type 2/haloperoxidase domain-containing protein n=1 Tax=Oryza meyeriana var. granulata TaxID=110450 RepID=A0A6G1ECD7_9ORYZ|nr:hypothetical protein E2562_024687 [Oryza meyeriana var. granulata]KAF0922124.1 hypothetical protein E2562_024687 [Oryza meyeriana var. granulata]